MKSFTYICLDILEVCEHNNLQYDTVMYTISNSDITYGNNADTLMSTNQLEDILGNKLDWDNHDEDTILISLGS